MKIYVTTGFVLIKQDAMKYIFEIQFEASQGLFDCLSNFE